MSPTKEESQSTQLLLSEDKAQWLKGTIRDVPDFPKAGIIFKDLTTLLREPEALNLVMDTMTAHCKQLSPDFIAAIEARGFIFGPAIARALNVGFVPVRKPGKLPAKVERETYQLEYGSDTIEIHADAVEKGQRVVLIDDLLATGGTALAAYSLLSRVGANVVGVGFVVELAFLNGRQRLTQDTDVFAVVSY